MAHDPSLDVKNWKPEDAEKRAMGFATDAMQIRRRLANAAVFKASKIPFSIPKLTPEEEAAEERQDRKRFADRLERGQEILKQRAAGNLWLSMTNPATQARRGIYR